MKKIEMSLLFLLSAGVLGAQVHSSAQPWFRLDRKINRALAIEQASAQTWQQQLKHLQTRFKQIKPSEKTLFEPPVRLPAINYAQASTYQQRLVQVQKKINQNTALKGYTFVAPVAQDLAYLSDENYAALHAFLTDAPLAKVVHTELVRPFTLAVQIKSITHGRLELWLSEPTRKVYLMSDNIYTTAAGKYGLQLK